MKLLFLTALVSVCAFAGEVTLDFNRPDENPYGPTDLGNYYNGGAGGNYGITARSIYQDAYTGGGALSFYLHSPGFVETTNGFTGSVSFIYAEKNAENPIDGLSVSVFGDNARVLDTIQLVGGTPGVYQTATLNFDGLGRTLAIGVDGVNNIYGDAGNASFDNLHFSNLIPVENAPEPGTWALMGMSGLLLIVGSRKFAQAK